MACACARARAAALSPRFRSSSHASNPVAWRSRKTLRTRLTGACASDAFAATPTEKSSRTRSARATIICVASPDYLVLVATIPSRARGRLLWSTRAARNAGAASAKGVVHEGEGPQHKGRFSDLQCLLPRSNHERHPVLPRAPYLVLLSASKDVLLLRPGRRVPMQRRRADDSRWIADPALTFDVRIMDP